MQIKDFTESSISPTQAALDAIGEKLLFFSYNGNFYKRKSTRHRHWVKIEENEIPIYERMVNK